MENVFISYSRQDATIVSSLVALIRCAGVSVFLDIESIEYGDNWKNSISKAISDCERFILVWSIAASKSEWVNKEYLEAKNLEKRIVPLLLDKTPLPISLAHIQACNELVPMISTFQSSIENSHLSSQELYERELNAARQDTLKAYPNTTNRVLKKPTSIHETLKRIRKPRVHIDYEIEKDGTMLIRGIDLASFKIATEVVDRIFSYPDKQTHGGIKS